METASKTTVTSSPLAAFSESLPFEIRIAQTPAELEGLCAARALAYSRHAYSAEQIAKLSAVDDSDRHAFLLIAEDKASKQIIGTLRFRSTRKASVPLNPAFPTQELGPEPSYLYADRFGVLTTYAYMDLVVLALIKAGGYLCLNEKTDWLLASAIRPMVRRYRRIGLGLLKGGEQGFPMSSVHPELYYGLGIKIAELPSRLFEISREYGAFYFAHVHKDIKVPVPDEVWAIQKWFEEMTTQPKAA